MIDCLYSLPTWTHSIFPGGDLEYLYRLFFTFSTYTPKLSKLSTGFLLKDILDRATSKSQSNLNPNYSMYVYSGHDINIINLLNTLGLYSLNVSNMKAKMDLILN